MLESPAYRVMSLSAHRLLARVEIELAHHGGHDNGALPVTYKNCVDFGIERHSIAPAQREIGGGKLRLPPPTPWTIDVKTGEVRIAPAQN